MQPQNENLAELTDDQAIDKLVDILNQDNLYDVFKTYVKKFDQDNAEIAPDGSVKIVRKPMEVVTEQDPNFGKVEMKGQSVIGNLFRIMQVGILGYINPGAKTIGSFLTKIKRLTPVSKEKDKGFNQNAANLLDSVSDKVRFSITIPNYAIAPALVAYLLSRFGGEVKIRDENHGKDGSYESIHINFPYKGINVEFQLHTRKNIELKKVTDIFYHAYIECANSNKDFAEQLADERSIASIEKEKFRQEIVKYSQVVYRHTDFRENVAKVEAIYNDFLRKGAKPKKPRKLSHCCMYIWKAEMVQKELAEQMPQILSDFQKMQNITLDFDKQPVTK